jgi:hypothetical protein
MRGAFVVQLGKATQGREFEGSVEEVDSGRQAKFHSENELIEFLRERFAQSRQGEPEEGGANARKNGPR